MPWSAQWLCVPLSAALKRAGHEVEVVVDGLEPGVADALAVPVRVLSPLRTHLGSNPRRFVERVAALVGGRAVISLTGRLAAPRWLPLDEPPGAMAARLCRELSPLSAALEFIHHPHLISEGLAWSRAEREAASRGWVRQWLGDPTCGGLGAVTRIPAECGPFHLTPNEARERLGMGGRPAVVVSVADDAVNRLGPLFRGLAILGNEAPQLLVLGHRTASITRLALGLGVGGGWGAAQVRTLGLTKCLSRILQAADAIAALPKCGHSSGGGGFIADALACGLPVAADPNASGAWMLGDADLIKGSDWATALASVCRPRVQQTRERAWLTIDDLAAKLLDVHLCSTKRA